MGADGVSGAGSDSVAGCGDAVTIHVRCSNGSKFSVQAPLDSTVGSFKALLAQPSDVPAEQQRLIYKGRILKDGQTLQSYGLESDHTVHLVRGFTPAASTDAPAGSNLGASRTSSNSQGTRRGLGSNEGGGIGGASFAGSLFPGLGANELGNNGTFGLHGTGFPEFDQIQQQLTENPNIMREIMNFPAIQNLVSNPELVRNLIMGNPQMREIIDQNPELAHVLNDPSILRQTLETARNPELTREMMRNTDRAMSNIESSPEGFNMLRRMYETVQEPLMNATAMAGESGVTEGSNPFAALVGNQGRVQNRDGSPLATGSDTTTGSPAPNSNPLPNPWSNPGRAIGAQNNNTRSPIAGDTRVPGPGDLGGHDFADLERMVGGMQDPSLLNQVMQNPAVAQIMQSLLSNPQYMNQILGFNPEMRSLLESNTQLREMLQNPEFLRQLSSPETLQQLLALQRSLLSHSGLQTGQELDQTGAATGTPNTIGLDLLMNMLGGLNAGGLNVPNTSNVPPEERYATQLSQLQEMGFFDTQENIHALSATAGNVHAAVERLLGNPNP